MLQVEVLEVQKKVLGPERPRALTTMNRLAPSYRKQGKQEEVGVPQAEGLEAQKKILGPEHPLTLESLESTYHERGGWSEAEKLLVELLEV